MKLSEWIKSYDEKYPECNGMRTISSHDLLKITEFDNQPERSKREDSQKCEMRCSEHCGNTVRDK